jgi:hypothetical protein
VAINADTAVVTGGNSLTLKKTSAGAFETETTLSGGRITWTVLAGPPVSFKVSTARGCVWEGKSA